MESEEHSAMPLAGGMMGHGHQCGMVWGAALAAGAQAYRLLGAGSQAETRAIIATQRLVESFRALNKTTDCFDITGMSKSSSVRQLVGYFLLKGGSIRCFGMAARYAQAAFRKMNSALSEEQIATTPAPGSVRCHAVPQRSISSSPRQDPSCLMMTQRTVPVSCAATLVKKMGASDLHAVMAAGLAGGMGLSGGACGALGAAIWIGGMNSVRSGAKIQYKSPDALGAIDRFTKHTNHEFVCSKIVGRKFASIDDHASYLRGGGCSKIIEVLAAIPANSPASN